MTLQECLDRLARGKLSNLAICEKGNVKPQEIPRVIDAVNEALERLHTQLPIREKSVIVELYEGRTEYPLTSEHSVRNMKGEIYDEYDYYIMDTEANPFLDDILVIQEVWDDLDRERPLNDPVHPLSVFTPEHNFISVNFSPDVRVLNVIYRAKHISLTADNLTDKVDIPSNLYGALLSYVAYLIHSNMNTELAVQNSQKYLAEYQNIIQEVIQNGTIAPDKLANGIKFFKRGWV